jgi:hypothetical protein
MVDSGSKSKGKPKLADLLHPKKIVPPGTIGEVSYCYYNIVLLEIANNYRTLLGAGERRMGVSRARYN